LTSKDTRNISVKEDVIQGAKKGGLAGSILGTALTILTIPALGPLAVAGPIVAALGGAAVGGVVGGLAGGSGALTHIGIPESDCLRVEQRLKEGAILIAVHTSNPAHLDKALRVFKSSGADEICSVEDRAASRLRCGRHIIQHNIGKHHRRRPMTSISRMLCLIVKRNSRLSSADIIPVAPAAPRCSLNGNHFTHDTGCGVDRRHQHQLRLSAWAVTT
jgi:hypothetical protein